MAARGGWGRRHGLELSSLEMALCFAVADLSQRSGESQAGSISEAKLLEAIKTIAGRTSPPYEARLAKALAGLDTKGVFENRRDGGEWVVTLSNVGQQLVAEERPHFVKGLAWIG